MFTALRIEDVWNACSVFHQVVYRLWENAIIFHGNGDRKGVGIFDDDGEYQRLRMCARQNGFMVAAAAKDLKFDYEPITRIIKDDTLWDDPEDKECFQIFKAAIALTSKIITDTEVESERIGTPLPCIVAMKNERVFIIKDGDAEYELHFKPILGKPNSTASNRIAVQAGTEQPMEEIEKMLAEVRETGKASIKNFLFTPPEASSDADSCSPGQGSVPPIASDHEKTEERWTQAISKQELLNLCGFTSDYTRTKWLNSLPDNAKKIGHKEVQIDVSKVKEWPYRTALMAIIEKKKAPQTSTNSNELQRTSTKLKSAENARKSA